MSMKKQKNDNDKMIFNAMTIMRYGMLGISSNYALSNDVIKKVAFFNIFNCLEYQYRILNHQSHNVVICLEKIIVLLHSLGYFTTLMIFMFLVLNTGLMSDLNQLFSLEWVNGGKCTRCRIISASYVSVLLIFPPF